MDQVPEKNRPSIYVKEDNSTYNNIRYVIMHILSDIFSYQMTDYNASSDEKNDDISSISNVSNSIVSRYTHDKPDTADL